MTWYHPKYYAALRAEKRKLQASSFKPQATSGKRQEPDRPAQPEIVLNKKSIDRDPDIGYRGIAPELSRVCRVAGRSSARAVPRPERDSDRSSSSKKTNSPLKVSAMSAVPVAGSFRAVSRRIHAGRKSLPRANCGAVNLPSTEFYFFSFFVGGWARRSQASFLRGGWAQRSQAQLRRVRQNSS